MEFPSDSIYNFIAYVTMKTRLLELEAEAETNQKQAWESNIMIGLLLSFCFRLQYVVFTGS